MGYYKDLREFVKALEKENLIYRITREINKDTELMPMVRWQFRGLAEEKRRAFLFENVTDVKGRKYDIPVLVGVHAASTKIYAMAMMCGTEEIMKKWESAQVSPIEPIMVESGPVHEEVHMGETLLEHGGLEEIPVPISTPGYDNAPYYTAANWVSKDPDTGIRNVGTYRSMVKSPTRLGIACQFPQHLRMHWQRCKERGESALEAALVIGPTPAVGLTSVSKIPYGTDEYAVAGGIAGEPIELVTCKTVDIEVPSTSEIVIEGEIPTDYLEREGPFGEHPGYVIGSGPNLPFNVRCITHRKNAIFCAFISQFPPSESSKLRTIGRGATIYNFLKYECNLPNILDVVLHENSGSSQFIVIRMKKRNNAEAWQALLTTTGFDPHMGKMVVAVDEDIDARDIDAVIWALCYRMQPQNDIKVVPGKLHQTDPSAAPPSAEGKLERIPGSALLIDATMKWAYPPVSLPRREFMERAKQIWEEEGLPALTPKAPWHGYELGFWPAESAEEAELALKGEYYRTGDKFAKTRLKL